MIKFFKKEKNFQKEKKDLWLNINIYWELAVLLMFLTVIFALFFGYSFFAKINKESVVSTKGDSNQIKTIGKERIDKVLQYFSLREQKSNQILNSPAPVVDPSL